MLHFLEVVAAYNERIEILASSIAKIQRKEVEEKVARQAQNDIVKAETTFTNELTNVDRASVKKFRYGYVRERAHARVARSLRSESARKRDKKRSTRVFALYRTLARVQARACLCAHVYFSCLPRRCVAHFVASLPASIALLAAAAAIYCRSERARSPCCKHALLTTFHACNQRLFYLLLPPCCFSDLTRMSPSSKKRRR